MNLYRRPGSPFWQFRFQQNGQTFRGSTGETSKRAARRMLDQARAAAPTAPPPGAMTFAVACARFWDEVGQHHAGAGHTRWSLDWLQRQIGAETPLTAIDDTLVAQLVQRRRAEPTRLGAKLKSSTINRSVTEPLRKVLLRAHKLHKAPIAEIDWRQHALKEPAQRVRELQPDEERALFAALPADYRPLVRFALITGCRLSECVGLTWADVGTNAITIRGKGGTVLTIPLPDAVRGVLVSVRGHDAVHVFTRAGRTSRVPIGANGLSAVWRRAKLAAGLTDYRFHDNRHSAATRVLRHGGNLALVQRLLRHSRIQTTMRYAHVQSDDVAEAMQRAAEAS